LATLESAERRFPASVTLRLLGRDVYHYNGRDQDAAGELHTLERLILSAPYRYASPEGRVGLGRFFLLPGADPRKGPDHLFEVAIKEQPDLVEAHLATAELALEKQDDALAADTLQKAPKAAAEDPRLHYLLARAFSAENRSAAEKEIAAALKINPNHVDSLLLQVDHRIDSERYADAESLLKRVFDVNPHEPRAFAYQAVRAHLRDDKAGEAAARRSGLARWDKNPEVDHLIGRELAQKYRFAEGAAAQHEALSIDADYLPAKIQLCQDLLRLGDEAEGW